MWEVVCRLLVPLVGGGMDEEVEVSDAVGDHWSERMGECRLS